MNVTENEYIMMKEYVAKNLVAILMNEKGMDMKSALDTLYNSSTYEKLNSPETSILFYQSPRYVFSYLEEELKFKN